VSAAEMADSLGVDIITSSLGYNVFDDKTMNYTYDDMNGKTTIITKGAEIAFAKGILVVASAGNEANKNWHYITAPSDGSNILCVGAVDKDRYIASFSSRGPSSDGRVKPDVLAQGVATTIIMSNGIVGSGSGTSYSGPVIAGMVACFWQAVPQYSNRQILDLIRSYSDRYENPDNIYGYGIPDFEKSAFLIDSSENKEIEQSGIDKLYPNPFTDKLQFHLMIDEAQNVTISLYDSKGVKVYDDTRFFSADTYNFIEITDLHTLQYGCYYLSVTTKESVFSNKVIKK
jgi:subtilisin family serine protease